MIAIIPSLALVLIVFFTRRARIRTRRAQAAEAARRADIERVLKRMLALALNDGRRGFIDVACWPVHGRDPCYLQLWPREGGAVLLKRAVGPEGAGYTLEINGVDSVVDFFPPPGTACDAPWFHDRAEKLFETLEASPSLATETSKPDPFEMPLDL